MESRGVCISHLHSHHHLVSMLNVFHLVHSSVPYQGEKPDSRMHVMIRLVEQNEVVKRQLHSSDLRPEVDRGLFLPGQEGSQAHECQRAAYKNTRNALLLTSWCIFGYSRRLLGSLAPALGALDI